MSKFNLEEDIPSLADKVIFITGGTAGLGAGYIIGLAKHDPAHIFFSGRNQKSAGALIQKVTKASPDVKFTLIRYDISSLASVREATAFPTNQTDRLDILMLNAGIMAVDAAVSSEGYETQFATNHLGHALLVISLIPTMQETAKVAASRSPKPGVDFSTLKSPQYKLGGMIPGHKWARYGQSKLPQLLYSQQLAKYYPNITSVAIHPGIIMTGLFENVSLSTKLPVRV